LSVVGLAVLVAVTLALTGTFPGSALKDGSGVLEMGVRFVDTGSRVYFLSPTLTNLSTDEVCLRDISPGATEPGLDFVGAHIFRTEDFDGAPPVAWGSREAEPELDPGRRESTPVAGACIAPGTSLTGFVMLEFAVTGPARPLTTTDVRVSYSSGWLSQQQTLRTAYTVRS
jgi:hypothetical protein